MLEIVDSHLHLWDPASLVPPWLGKAPQLLRRFDFDDWRGAAGIGDGWCLKRAVYVEIDAAPADRARENELVFTLARKPASPIAGVVIAADLSRSDIEADLASWLGEPRLKGVRHVLHMPASPRGACLAPDFLANMLVLGRLGLTFDACMRRDELGDLARLAHACQETTIVLDHAGNPGEALFSAGLSAPELQEWRSGIEALARCRNVSCKISGFPVPAAAEPERIRAGIDFCLDAFGEDRVMFASNYPVCELGIPFRPWLDLLLETTRRRPARFLEKLFGANAVRLYRLDP
ncbi:amidohydrolase family protein [Consotaella salsifontis]|uniref:Predicted metal-dependent hydrolase, TIM-barrel fold n=1 Tax=Consotaella salsifontis TaxID=1365950 RepID=A0A1T4S7A6_9HYPH|nr:amidohydrolase family protein [Consotaella salsifontis]SKA24037.1 Predicted metal-dependent hydrolase, TIM-barrel fold [Consotaella salsifontis]